MAIETTTLPDAAARSDLQRIAVVLAMILEIGATFLPSLGLGDPIQERSDATRTLITPSGWAFAIWGPLFAGSFVFAIYQALPAQRDNALLDRLAWPATGAFAAIGMWAVYTQFYALTAVSVAIIVTALACLLTVFRILVDTPRDFSRGERWLVVLVFSALAAWLTAASIVNIAATLTYYGVDAGGANAMLAAAVVIVGGIIVALAVWRGRGNPIYAAVFLWALSAIYGAGGQVAAPVAYATILAGVLVIIATTLQLRHAANRRHWLG